MVAHIRIYGYPYVYFFLDVFFLILVSSKTYRKNVRFLFINNACNFFMGYVDEPLLEHSH